MRYLLVLLLVSSVVRLQAQEIDKQDYERAVRFVNYWDMAFNLKTNVYWYKDGSGFWFIDYSKAGKYYKTVAFKDYKVRPLFDQNRLATVLTENLKKAIDPNALNISEIEKLNDHEFSFRVDGKIYNLDINTYDLKQKDERLPAKGNPFESTSPDGNWIAYTKDYNLYVRSKHTGETHQLSHDGKKDYEYATYYGWYDLIKGENGERPKHFSVNWSNDSKWLTTSIVDFRNAEKMYLLNYTIDSLYKPQLLSYYRGSPGDTTLVDVKPVFFNIETKQEIKTTLPANTHFNPVNVRWSDKPGQCYAFWKERGFQKAIIRRIDLNTNTDVDLVVETSKTNIDNFEYKLVEEKEVLLFLSERNGWRQLYALNLKDNTIRPLTNGDYYVNSIEFIDSQEGVIYFLASGKEAGENPYHQKLYKVNLKGKLTVLTPEFGHHIVSFSKDGKYFVDNYSTLNIPTTSVLRAVKSGKVACELTKANVEEAKAKGWEAPEVFELTAKDGKTTIYGALWKPSNFDPSRSYPIIDNTYTGPHTQIVPKSFDVAFANQALAELGFVVMRIDGLGTSGRSKAFHDHSYKDMGNNLEDHVKAIGYLGKKHTWIDTDKVGIFGHSAGGYDTGRALLAFPGVYKVGVASSADHDFRMEKAWWPEMYQGWPVDDTYQEVSNITNAKNLKGKLLLVHGGLDDNVNPSATFKLAEALVKADKEFDLLILPSQRHGYSGISRDYFMKKRWNYFVEHLKGEQPIWDFKLK
ncbi:S9 family peptidase [Snuella lapsa]|uniref:S9 family peptidase n=1 Tax=Snuella lapsa TaxID=870481 RepID=A0ABP6WNP5_9FLAO